MTLTLFIALFTSAILAIQLLLGLFLGADTDVDFDGDSSGDFDVSSIFSPKGILHFVTGSSWYLVSVGKDIYHFSDYIIAASIGLAFSLLMIGVYWLMYKLQCFKKKESGEDLVGKRGTIYLPMTSGFYLVDLEISGSIQSIEAKPEEKRKYQTGDIVIIKEYREGIYIFN